MTHDETTEIIRRDPATGYVYRSPMELVDIEDDLDQLAADREYEPTDEVDEL